LALSTKSVVGGFKGDKPWEGMYYDKVGNVRFTASDGVWKSVN